MMKGLDYLGAISSMPMSTVPAAAPASSTKSVALKVGAGLVLVGIIGVSLIVPVGIIILLLRKK